MRWKPFLLRPNMPENGKAKDPVKDPAERVGAWMKRAGDSVSPPIEFTGKCDRYPNSLAAHGLLKYAGEHAPAKQNALQEVLFRQYFHDGLYPEGANLAAAAAEVGLDGEAARAFAESDAAKKAVAGEAREASASGITGVPYFFFNGQPAFSGAQDQSVFLRALEEA